MKFLAYHPSFSLGKKMRVIHTLGLFFFALSIYAQTPDYFGNNPTWTGNKWWDDASQTCSNQFQFAFYIDSTITLDSLEYHILRERGIFSQGIIMGGMGDCETNYNYNSVAAYIRQEGRKIFRFIGGQDSLMIDYEVGVGDTMKGHVVGPGSIFKDLSVTAIDSVLINGEYRRRFYFDTVWGFDNAIVIEGIGTFPTENWSQGEFINPSLGIGISAGENIYCYGQNDTTYWTYDSLFLWGCNYYVTVPKAPDKIKFKIFPNPSQGKLKISFSPNLKVDIVQIQNTQGRQFLKEHISIDEFHEMDLSNLVPGVYLCNVYSNGRLIGTERIVIR